MLTYSQGDRRSEGQKVIGLYMNVDRCSRVFDGMWVQRFLLETVLLSDPGEPAQYTENMVVAAIVL